MDFSKKIKDPDPEKMKQISRAIADEYTRLNP